MEARHKVKRQKLQAQHRAAVEKLEKGIREGSRRQARELYVVSFAFAAWSFRLISTFLHAPRF